MKSKQKKSEELKQLKVKLPKSKITIFTTFSRAGEKGLSVSQMSELKRALRAIHAEYFVTKKSLIDLALKNLKRENVDVYGMDGSIGLVFSDEDAYAVSKKLYEFAKKNTALQFFGAIFENSFMGKEGFLEMAKMPSREMLIARLLSMITYPVRSLAIVLNEISKKKSLNPNL